MSQGLTDSVPEPEQLNGRSCSDRLDLFPNPGPSQAFSKFLGFIHSTQLKLVESLALTGP